PISVPRSDRVHRRVRRAAGHVRRAVAARAGGLVRHRARDLVALEAVAPGRGADAGRAGRADRRDGGFRADDACREAAYAHVMSKALFIVDVQNDFTEGGALGVEGGDAVAERISRFLAEHADEYSMIVASRDWHDGDNDNGGHFASGEPDFIETWPVHCVGGTEGADYDPAFDTSRVTHHVKKGQGQPAYSMFEGTTDEGESVHELLERHGAGEVDTVGIATVY